MTMTSSTDSIHDFIESSNANDGEVQIPVIDLRNSNDEEVATQLWNAARNAGFFTLINHSIPQHQIDTLFALSSQFFALDSEMKHQYPFDREKNSGYEYMTQKPPSTNVVDVKETFQVTAREGCMDGLWPVEFCMKDEDAKNSDECKQQKQDFQDIVLEMIDNSHALACRLLSLIESRACPHVEGGTLPSAHHIWGKDGQCTLRLLHYPPTANTELEQEDTGERWRCGSHTDWGSLTLLFQRVGEDGLECRRREDEGVEDDSARWVKVPPLENGITVNIGDMLKRWSDCKLYSNLHRVRMPKTVKECNKSRYSIAFFLQADKSALIENTTDEPITAGDYFAARINSHFEE